MYKLKQLKNRYCQDLHQKDKQLSFLVAMPRSGNTLFASVMNQNPEITCTANSITLEIMKDLFLLKQTDVFQNYPDHNSLDNVMNSVFDNFYKDWPQKYIIDRGPVTLQGNLEIMQKYYKKPFKCIVLLRDLMDVLASYMQWYTENPNAFPNKFGNNDDIKLSKIMNKDGAVAKGIEAIKNAKKNTEMCHFVKYDDFVINPKEEIKKIYNFLNIPHYPHYFDNLKQVNINGLSYDDTIMGTNMHTLFNGPIRKVYNPYIEKIPTRIREKYGHIRF